MPSNPAAGGGGNPSGYNIAALPSQASPSPIGGFGQQGRNPLLPGYPSNTQSPGIYSPFSGVFPANTGGMSGGPGGGANPAIAGMPPAGTSGQDLARGLRDAGVPSDIAAYLAQFINSGAGYNPAVLQQLFAALQPQINRGEADIMEHYGSMGLGMSSPAAIGMGDFLSQVNLNEGQIAAQLYEQSIQNMLGILNGKQSQDSPGFWQTLGEGLLGKALGLGTDKGTSYLTDKWGNRGSSGGSSSGTDLAGLMAAVGFGGGGGMGVPGVMG